MAIFTATYELYDSAGRTGRKLVEFDSVDFATAETAAGALADDLQAITELELISYTVASRTVYGSGVQTAGSNLDEAGVFSLRKTDGYKASHRVPGIIQAARTTGSDALDTTNAAVVAYFQNWITGDARMSDGEQISALLKGVLEK